MHRLITPYAADFAHAKGRASKPNVLIKQFPDSESWVYVPGIKSLKNKKVTIYHRLYPEPDKRIFELLLLLSRVKKETKHIELFVPYLPYARQDKEHKPGEIVSADILCGLLQDFGVKKLITYDCHFLPKPGKFLRAGLAIENRSAGNILKQHAKKYFGREKFFIISPDQGTSYFVNGVEGYAMHKKRSRTRKNDVKTEVEVLKHKMKGLEGVKGKNICMLDDIIATGGTIVKAAEHLKTMGAKKIIVGSVHGIFCGDNIAGKILQSGVSELFITNAILGAEIPARVKILSLPKL